MAYDYKAYAEQQRAAGTSEADIQQGLYDTMKAQGGSVADVDASFGWDPGTSQTWVDKNIAPAVEVGGGAGYTAPQTNTYTAPKTTTSSTGSLGSYQPKSANEFQTADGGFDILGYRDNLREGAVQQTGAMTDDAYKELYYEMYNRGMTGAQVDAALGMPSGQTDQWVKDMGLAPLGGQAPSSGGVSVGGGGTYTPPATGGQQPYTPPPATGGVSVGGGTGTTQQTTTTGQTGGLLGQQPGFGGVPVTPGATGPNGEFNWTTPGTVMGQPNGSMFGLPQVDPSAPLSYAFQRPNLRQVQNEDTVQGQLAQIQESDSDLMKLAERRGLEQAAQRGLLNTSLASQAAQLAVLQEAMPIAQADAAAYLKQGMTNQAVENEFLGRIQQTALDSYRDERTGQIDMKKMAAEYAEKGKLLAQEYDLKSEDEAAKQNAALWAQYIQAVAEINKSPEMGLNAKKEQINALKETTFGAMQTNARFFGNPEMLDFYTDQLSKIDVAVDNLQAQTPVLYDGLDQNGNKFWLTANNQRVYEGAPAPQGYEWIIDQQTGGLDLRPVQTTLTTYQQGNLGSDAGGA